MKTTFKVIQVVLVVAIVGLTLLIFLRGNESSSTVTKKENDLDNPQRQAAAQQQASTTSTADFDFESYKQKRLNALSDSAQKAYLNLSESGSGTADTAEVHNQVQFWKGESYPALAGYFQKQLAQKAGGPQAWTRAGNFFQRAQKEVTDSVVKQVAINQAMTCFKTALDRKPKSLEAKAGLALTYIEGKQQVMQGVSLLKEIIEVNPRHRKALFYLGMLSIRSGQYKKARTRFQKLVEIQPQNPFNHLYLGNVQEQLGNKEAALQEFRKYQKLVNQPKLKANAEEKINALKQSQKN